MYAIRLASSGCLPVECKTEDENYEAGRRGESYGQRRIGHPAGECLGAALQNGELAAVPGKVAHGGKGRAPVGKRYLQHPSCGSECRQGLTWTEHLDQAAADISRLEREGTRDAAVATVDRGMPHRGNNDAIAVRHQYPAPGYSRPTRNDALELALETAVQTRLFQLGAIHPGESIAQIVGRRFNLVGGLADCLATVIKHLHDCSDADCEQECDDQRRHRATQSRLRGEQPEVSRLGDGLS